MKLINKFRSLKLFWKIFTIWGVLVLVSSMVNIHLYKKHEKYTEEIEESLYRAYKQTMTSYEAYQKSSWDAIHYPENKEEIKKKYGIEDAWLPFSDLVVKDLKQVNKWRGIFLNIMLPTLLLGFIFWLSYFFFIIYKLIRKKLTKCGKPQCLTLGT